MMFIRAIYMALLLLLIVLSSCDNQSQHNNYRIGVSQCSGGSWRDKQNNEMRRELLLHEGVSMELRCANDDDKQQMADIQHFIDEKVDILIVSPFNINTLSEVIGKAYDAGIPVLLFDRITNDDKFTAFVGGDNYAVGKQMAAYLVTRLHNGGKVIEITGDMNTSPAEQRHRGFLDEIRKGNGIELLTVDAGWEGRRTEQLTDSMIRIHPDVDAIVAHTDYMAGEAKKIIDGIYPDNDCIFVGADGFGTPGIGIEAVEKGELDATAIYSTGGDAIIQTALKILNGEDYDKTTMLPSMLVSTPQEAMLLISMERALTAESARVERMHDRATVYLQEFQKERVMFYTALGVLLVICGLCVALFRLNKLRRKSNKRLYEQQNKLMEKNEQLQTMASQLEEATNAKLVFFTNISHDFRTPLNLIAAPLEEVIGKLENNGGDNKEVTSLLHIVRRNVGVLLDLVNQILDFRKVENGKMSLKLQSVDVNRLIGAWHESFSSLAQKKGIRLDFKQCDGECLATVDVRKLERMVYNVLGNSIKFTPEGGVISLRCMKDDKLTISVGDTGPGIDKEHLDKIFERFYQIEKTGEEGTGIGLALVKKYAELMGGRVEIESNSDKTAGQTGTRISIVIPSAQPNADASVSEVAQSLSPESLLSCSNLPSAEPIMQQNVTEEETRPVVLVIDDNADMRSFIYNLLSEKYRVLTACDGEQGLRFAKESIPDIVVCDVMMPVMDGLECCQKMKNDVCTSHIPVIMLTACSLDEQRVSGLQSGAEAYLAKPFNSPVLLAQIDTLLKNRSRVSLFRANAAEDSNIPEDSNGATESKKTVENNTSVQSLSRYDRGFLEKLRENIEENYSDENFSVEVLADKMCLSRAQLYRKCKALTGYKPVEIIRNTRLEHAHEMLLDGYDQISHIAAAVGIPNATYFTKCYKAYFGDYPKDTMS